MKSYRCAWKRSGLQIQDVGLWKVKHGRIVIFSPVLVFIYWSCGSSVCLLFSSLFFYCFEAQSQTASENNSDISRHPSRTARGLLPLSLGPPLIDEQRFLWRTPDPLRVKAWSWVVPCKASTHVLSHKISPRMLIAEDQDIHERTHTHTHINTCHGFVCMITVISAAVWSVLIYGCGAGGQSLCLCSVAVMPEEWPASLNLYVLLER